MITMVLIFATWMFILSIHFTHAVENDALLHAVYWEAKPFIFTNKNGDADGIIPKMFLTGGKYCANVTFIKFLRKEPSRTSFYNLLRSNTLYGENQLKNITKEKATWFPVIDFNEENPAYENEKGLRSFQLMKSKEIAIIVPRSMISLPNKLLRGILSCQQVIIISLLLSVLFGITVWLVERFYNEDFPKTFIKGAGTGFWWSLVSMTTVGYGDIVPKTVVGRILALVWVFIGVMIACVMTATTTEIVNGVDDLSVYGRKVSALGNSYEEKVAKMDFRANVLAAESYKEVLDLVRKGEVFAGMMNADVAAWMQNEIHGDDSVCPLRIIKKVPANLYVNALIYSDISKEAKEVFKCMFKLQDEVYTHSIEHYQRYCHTESLYTNSVWELFKQNTFIQVLFGIVVSLMLLGLGLDGYKLQFRGVGSSGNCTDCNCFQKMSNKERQQLRIEL